MWLFVIPSAVQRRRRSPERLREAAGATRVYPRSAPQPAGSRGYRLLKWLFSRLTR